MSCRCNLNLNNKFIKTLTHIRMFQLFNDSCLQLRFSQACTVMQKLKSFVFYLLRFKVFLWWCFSAGLLKLDLRDALRSGRCCREWDASMVFPLSPFFRWSSKPLPYSHFLSLFFRLTGSTQPALPVPPIWSPWEFLVSLRLFCLQLELCRTWGPFRALPFFDCDCCL